MGKQSPGKWQSAVNSLMALGLTESDIIKLMSQGKAMSESALYVELRNRGLMYDSHAQKWREPKKRMTKVTPPVRGTVTMIYDERTSQQHADDVMLALEMAGATVRTVEKAFVTGNSGLTRIVMRFAIGGKHNG